MDSKVVSEIMVQIVVAIMTILVIVAFLYVCLDWAKRHAPEKPKPRVRLAEILVIDGQFRIVRLADTYYVLEQNRVHSAKFTKFRLALRYVRDAKNSQENKAG